LNAAYIGIFSAGQHQVRDRGAVADLDEELVPHCAEEPLDLPSSLRFPRPGVDEPYAEDGAAAQQPRIGKGRAVVNIMKSSS
jgi:hypothetical protein